ncbi:MAG TPA: rhomboid family intramembrane serine protease [Bacteroidales bacterium]|jgi:membrane associated rhomboid family serine protease|nr:rhomboid family intramembrane serine protease [Bacteroidales bacterium]HNY52087.1 rhomboid family intramembrane serine protease [Bacteroidales bacterium]HOG56954.1 rhomboid family intramembrane serine protease [Bacteroidales bacterium]HPX43148.1 rhomboid family intramembrane serine protease [Bacteroidales bacterium]HQB86196.1 rhomboid family intramembrane serine protease [Bacteroidales bacterium]
MSLWHNIKKTFSDANKLNRLIYINVAVFLFLSAISIITYLFNDEAFSMKVLRLFAVPASLRTLAMKPWTLITYMFTHKDILHILFNMLWLYWFGRIFLEYLDQRKLVVVYILGGISGAIVYVLSFNIFPVFTSLIPESVAIGASASVMAVVVAIAAYVPNYPVHLLLIGRVKIIWIAVGIFVLTSFMDFSVNSGGKLAHMGGALFGYLYIVNLRKGKDPGRTLNRIIDSIASLFKARKEKMKVSYSRKKTDYEYNKAKAERQEKIDRILDKISKGGYDSLTKEEKDLLFSESQKQN